MKITITAFFVLFTILIKAQTPTEKCWTPEMDTTEFRALPWYDNNNYLEHFLDSIGYPPAGAGNRIVGAPVRFWIPIKFWIYRDDNGNGGPNQTQIQLLMDDLNRRYNQTNNAMIGFYMKCSPAYINNSTHVNKTFAGASLLMAANNDAGCINVHIIGSFNQANTAGFSIPFLNASMIPSGAYLISTANGDLAHEIGHVLGLQHTHQYAAWNWKCLTECVSRTRTWPTFNLCLPNRLISKIVCESTGDGLRDTQADKNLVSNNSCNYTVSFGNDNWGDSYDNPPIITNRPDITNIMSYNSATNCVDHFSRLQIAVMLYTLYFKKTIDVGGYRDVRTTFDSYEPDNESITARNISLNEVQERNFHQQYNRLSGNVIPFITQCDVDWVRFVAPCSRNFDILTSAINGRTNANTRLTLFSNTLVQLAQNDNISATNFFSKINWAFVAGQEYFIRIENMSSNVTGYYTLEVGNPFVNALSITGNNGVCPSGSYAVAGLPAGATISWGASPLNLVTFSCNTCSLTTVNRVADGIVTITATVSINICGVVFVRQVSREITSGSPPISITSSTNGCSGQYQQWNLVNNTPSYGSNWSWSVGSLGTNSQITIFSPSSASTGLSVKGGGAVRLNYTDLCGVARTDGVTVYSTCSGFGLVVSPNPAQDNINVSLLQVDNSTTSADATIASAKQLRVVESNGKTIMSLFEVNTNMLVKQWKHNESKNPNYSLKINGLRKGIYILQVDRDNQTNVTKIIIE